MRHRLAWVFAVSLMIAGSQVAHALAYRAVAPDLHVRVRLLAGTGHGYEEYLPLMLGVGFALELAWLVRTVLEARRGRRPTRQLAAWPFALLPPLAFTIQEHLERLVHTGVFPWHAVLAPTFLPGLLLQIPFAVLVYLCARVLLGFAQELGQALAGQPLRIAARAPRAPLAVEAPRRLRPALVSGRSERGPPALALS